MRVLLVGRWGKTHALAMGLKRNKEVKLYSVTDKMNSSISKLSDEHVIGDIRNKNYLLDYAEQKKIDMAVITPEMSLRTGITDSLRAKGIPTVGASKICSILEGDKAFLRQMLLDYDFDAAVDFQVFEKKEEARDFLLNSDRQYAIKPAGITDGDGVRVMGQQLEDKHDAIEYVNHIFDNCLGGLARVIIEERLEGEEFTLQTFSDGNKIVGMPAVRDYKLHYEGEKGENTPGMGSYSCADHLLPFLSKSDYEKGIDTLNKIIYLMNVKYGAVYKGFLTVQYMVTNRGLKLIEINVRPGDCEILNIIPILKTDLTDICMAIARGTLDKMSIQYDNNATVCKYKVPPVFPRSGKKPVQVEIDKKAIESRGGHLFQSCFNMGNKMYEPSPRLFAVTAVADDVVKAREKCEECLQYIQGDNLYHRKDIGSKELMEFYYEHRKSIN